MGRFVSVIDPHRSAVSVAGQGQKAPLLYDSWLYRHTPSASASVSVSALLRKVEKRATEQGNKSD